MKGKKPVAAPETKITCGSSQITGDEMVGKSVSAIRRKVGKELNVPKGAKPYVNGKEVKSDCLLQKGESLEFLKKTGKNG